MMERLLEANREFLFSKKVFFSHTDKLQELTSALNSKKIAIVSGMRYSGKTKFIKDMIYKTGTKNNFFYFNAEIDKLSQVKDTHDLQTLLELHKRVYGDPKIIILQNINKIENIKSYIGNLYTEKKYKIIIVGNNIKIGGIDDIQIFPSGKTSNINDAVEYGCIEEVQLIKDTYFRKFLLDSISQHILSYDAIGTYDIKNQKSYYNTISFLSEIDANISLRELQRNLEASGVSIALMTLMDYIDISIKTRILSKVTKYDIKNNKKIPTKVTYYFSDTGIRNTLATSKNKNISIKNAIQNELEKKGYTIYTGVNGRFEFTFYAVKDKKNICIHFHDTEDKNELRKDARKLLKVNTSSDKFLIVKDKNTYNLRKYNVEDVIIGEIEDIIGYI